MLDDGTRMAYARRMTSTTYNFSVRHGDTIIPVQIDGADSLEDAAIQAAAAAQQTVLANSFHVYTDLDGIVGSYSAADIANWWA